MFAGPRISSQQSAVESLTAHDGEEAVAAALIFRPDVILLDIALPSTWPGNEQGRMVAHGPAN
jgi:DNA-binding response OmpR family regulator